MFDYNALVKACRSSKININKKGNNPWVNGRPISAFEDPFDLTKINFPKRELKQVQKIGELLYNLLSQQERRPCFYLHTKAGREKSDSHYAIKQLIPIVKEALDYYVEKGLKKSKKPKNDLIVADNGKIYEDNPSYWLSMREMNDRLSEFRRGNILKQARSRESASKVIFNA